ncbi:unnamed protein product [Rotaria socialis]
MSGRFSDPSFVVTSVLDGRFKLLWLDNLQALEEEADARNVVEYDDSDKLTQHVDPITKRNGKTPATSAPIEGTFSQSGFVTRPHSASLT